MVETISLKRLSSDGSAVGRLADGRAVFVDYGCPGDVVRVMIDEDRPRFARGHVGALVQASPLRVTPPCPHFGWGACGGCRWQHLLPSAALAAKRDAIIDAMQRIAGIADAESLTLPIIGSPADYEYRNKIELDARTVRGHLSLGLHRAGSAELVEPGSCPLFSAPFKDLLNSVQGALRYSLGSADVGLSRVALRYSARTKSFELACMTRPGSFPRARVASTCKAACPEITSIVRVMQKTTAGRGSRKHPIPVLKGVEALFGAGYWKERLAGFPYKVSAPSFFQVNTAATEGLVEIVKAALELDGSEHACDLYSGVGAFSLPLAASARRLTVVESSGPAVRDLRRNLAEADLSAEVIAGQLGRDTEDIGQPDAVLVDPPRAGLSAAAICAIEQMAPERLVYVSCDPATLARDLRLLTASSFRLESLRPVDLFPQTPHVECVAKLRKV
ncbi:MAG: 23S rRNA (uracil(1939)-C(5))-methyltransferase RlmD [Actinomycetia bacterium]|nr:23S rRNA (uracil(1939)-C(5))-methyltransferase RlmD [Actinomycetes bacterium]